MKIELTKIFVRDLIDGYENNDEEGVVAYHGQISRSTSIEQVAKSIRYSLNHSKIYQKIKVDEKEKVVYTYYE